MEQLKWGGLDLQASVECILMSVCKLVTPSMQKQDGWFDQFKQWLAIYLTSELTVVERFILHARTYL